MSREVRARGHHHETARKLLSGWAATAQSWEVHEFPLQGGNDAMPVLSRDCFFKSISVQAWPAYYAQSSHHPLSFSLPFGPSGNPGSESWCRAGPVLPSSQLTPEQRLGWSGIMYISPNPALGTPSPWHRDNPALPHRVPHPGTAPAPLPPDTHLLVQTFSSAATPQLLSQRERGALLPHIKAGSSAEPNPPHSIPATGCSVCQPCKGTPPCQGGDTASPERGHRQPLQLLCGASSVCTPRKH